MVAWYSPAAAEKSIHDLPRDLLELILSKLTLKWNIHASLVCKRWQAAAVAVRVVKISDILAIFSAVGRKLDLLNFKVDLLTGKVESLVSAVTESDRQWLLAFELLSNQLSEVKRDQESLMSKCCEQQPSSSSSGAGLASDDEPLANLAKKAKRSGPNNTSNQVVAASSKRISSARPKESTSSKRRR